MSHSKFQPLNTEKEKSDRSYLSKVELDRSENSQLFFYDTDIYSKRTGTHYYLTSQKFQKIT